MAALKGTGPLETGVRVSLELSEAGTCVAVVVSLEGTTLTLDLLDDLPEGELEPGSAVDLFMPRQEGIYHWLCSLSSLADPERAELELLGPPMLVQRRAQQRVDAELQAKVRRIRSARRGPTHDMTVADLSHGGLKLYGPFQLSTGDTIEVTVDLGAPVHVVGRAVMAYPTPYGAWAAHVSFLDGQRDAIDVVDGYLAIQLRARL